MKTKGKRKRLIKPRGNTGNSVPPPGRSRLGRLIGLISSHPKLLALISLSMVGTLLYFNSIHNEFVFDDISLIVKSKSIGSLSKIPEILGMTSRPSGYRPIRQISYAIDYQFTGLNPVGYHLSNILYHILAAYLVFLITSFVSKDKRIAGVAALLFISHPIQTESVAYIAGRRDILSALFFFLGFYFFLKLRESPSKKYLFVIYLSYVLSLLSKEMGVTLPAILLLYDLLRKPLTRENETGPPANQLQGFFKRLKEILRRHWAFYLTLLVIAILFTFHEAVLKHRSRQLGFYGGTMSSNFLTVFNIWVFYIRMLILPLSLNAAHSFPISRSIFEPGTLLPVSILLAIFALLIKLIKKKELYSFGGFWFFITLLPVSHIFPHHELLAEHYLYLPSFGFSLMTGLLFSDLFQRVRWKPLIYLPLAGLVFFYAYQTIDRNQDWKNELTLWADTARKSPDNFRAKLNLGVSYMSRGEYDKAIQEFRTSIQIKGDNPTAYNNLGVIYLEKEDFDQAIAHFRKAISFQSRYAEAHGNLANALAMKGSTDEAIEEEKRAISIDPKNLAYHFNLARLYEVKALWNEATMEYRETLRLDPKFFEARYQLGMIYTRLEKNKEAISEFEKAIELDPRSGKTYLMLAVNLMKGGDRENAARNLEKALRFVSGEKEREKIQSLLNRLESVPKSPEPLK